ncbi:putative FMN-dependent luciferase-like monooxygenase [Segnochrobactraceae bacterium EtOH-i3]
MPPKRLGFFTRLLDDVPAVERYRIALDQILLADRLGFDTAWVAQHHFHAAEGGLPSPFPFLAHVAARTTGIRLGTGVITLPMENPVRVAEDAAVTDLLSGGRLELGFGTGATPASYLAFGIDHSERGVVHGRNLATVRDAFAGRALGHGENRLYPEAPSLGDRMWQATFSVAGGEFAGRDGDGLMLSRTQPRPKNGPWIPLAEIQIPIIDAYEAALPEGRPSRIMASRSLFVADSRDEAMALAETGLTNAIAGFQRSGYRFLGHSVAELIQTLDVHIGTPAEVIDSLAADPVLARASDIVFQVHNVDPPPEKVRRSLELLATEVAPALGWGARRSAA